MLIKEFMMYYSACIQILMQSAFELTCTVHMYDLRKPFNKKTALNRSTLLPKWSHMGMSHSVVFFCL